VPAGAGAAPCALKDRTYAMSCRICSSLTSPWNVGMSGWNPATIFACGLTAVYAVVGGALVIWGDPGALSFDQYGDTLVKFAGAIGLLGIGRGIAAAKGK